MVNLKIAVNPPKGGTTDPEPCVYSLDAGTDFHVTAFANENYIFLHWLLNGSYHSSDQSIAITVDRNMELTAVFTEQQ